jgi:superfamily I DNA/RNA helicase
MPYLELRQYLKLDGDDEELEDGAAVVPSEDVPRIMVTTLVGAKGLQAKHVFVAGLNEGHFPASNGRVTDDEVCCLLVAVTRAQKSCTLVSCGRFDTQALRASIFLRWLDPHLQSERVDAEYFRRLR